MKCAEKRAQQAPRQTVKCGKKSSEPQAMGATGRIRSLMRQAKRVIRNGETEKGHAVGRSVYGET